MAVTLKPKHSLVGRSLLPVIMQLKTTEELEGDGQLARLKRDHPLEHYSSEELISEFRKLTGESLADVLTLAGKTMEQEMIRYAVHLTIIHANAAGAPKGQSLSEPVRQADQGQTSGTNSARSGDQAAANNNGSNGMLCFLTCRNVCLILVIYYVYISTAVWVIVNRQTIT